MFFYFVVFVIYCLNQVYTSQDIPTLLFVLGLIVICLFFIVIFLFFIVCFGFNFLGFLNLKNKKSRLRWRVMRPNLRNVEMDTSKLFIVYCFSNFTSFGRFFFPVVSMVCWNLLGQVLVDLFLFLFNCLLKPAETPNSPCFYLSSLIEFWWLGLIWIQGDPISKHLDYNSGERRKHFWANLKSHLAQEKGSGLHSIFKFAIRLSQENRANVICYCANVLLVLLWCFCDASVMLSYCATVISCFQIITAMVMLWLWHLQFCYLVSLCKEGKNWPFSSLGLGSPREWGVDPLWQGKNSWRAQQSCLATRVLGAGGGRLVIGRTPEVSE